MFIVYFLCNYVIFYIDWKNLYINTHFYKGIDSRCCNINYNIISPENNWAQFVNRPRKNRAQLVYLKVILSAIGKLPFLKEGTYMGF